MKLPTKITNIRIMYIYVNVCKQITDAKLLLLHSIYIIKYEQKNELRLV